MNCVVCRQCVTQHVTQQSAQILSCLHIATFMFELANVSHNKLRKSCHVYRSLHSCLSWLTGPLILLQIMSVWSDAAWGLGSNGGRDGCVYSGPFRKHVWKLTNGNCLKRNFNGNIDTFSVKSIILASLSHIHILPKHLSRFGIKEVPALLCFN